jgi:hypothetical protein
VCWLLHHDEGKLQVFKGCLRPCRCSSTQSVAVRADMIVCSMEQHYERVLFTISQYT